MSETLVRKVVLAAVKGEKDNGGFISADAPRATDKEIWLAIMEAHHLGLAEACDVSNHDSHYPEWKLLGPTGASRRYFEETRRSKKAWGLLLAGGAGILAFLAWLIPVLISILRK